MGLSVNTRDAFAYVLEDRRDLPEQEQPYLVFRYLSARDHARMEKHFSTALESNDPESIIDEALQGIRLAYVGCHGYEDGHDYLNDSPIQADAILSRADIMELVRELGQAMTVSQREKKASVSRLLSTSDRSAGETPPASA